MPRSATLAKSSWILTLASIAVVVGALYLAKGVLLPLIMAVLITFLLSPACDWLERRRLGRTPAVLGTVILTFAGFGVITWTAVSQMTELAPKIAQYQGNIEAKFKALNELAAGAISKLTRTTKTLGEPLRETEAAAEVADVHDRPFAVRVVSTPPSPLEVFGGMFGTVLESLTSAGIVILLVLFFLHRREDLRDRFIRLVGQGQVTGTTQALNDAATRVSRYLFTQFAINIVFGFCVTIGLYLIGIPNAILWGILTAVLKFIPYIGVWIAALAPFLLSMAISTSWTEPLMVASVFILLEFAVGNFVEPWLFGKHTGVSAVAILVAAVFWSWLWGGVGLLLATPLTVCLLVLGKHVPQLAFLDIMLGNEPVFDRETRIYQRLLAGDQEEASELIEQTRQDLELVDVYDQVILPVLQRAEKDRFRDAIEQDRLDFILNSLTDIVDDLGDSEHETQDISPEEGSASVEVDSTAETALRPPATRVLCVSAATRADEIATTMLSQLIGFSGGAVRVMTVNSAADLAAAANMEAVDLVIISAMPPGAATHARHLRRRLPRALVEARVIIGLWNFAGDLDAAVARIGRGDGTQVTSTLREALRVVQELVAPTDEPTVKSKPQVAIATA